MKSTLIDQYIDKQSVISAIETFSEKHDLNQIAPETKTYRELLPSKSPQPGQQYAFEVDLDKCTGCKACVTACHNENGLDIDETWRSVGVVQGGTNTNAKIQHVTTACHHCAEPACMSGCPTKAYTKDDITGIVKHLDDQCFGCQYCILKCPYDVPKYNKKKGIVHKCDMCVGRLENGQAPACVRACPQGAIKIAIVDKKEVMEKSERFVDVPDAPRSDYTYPTTRYTSKEPLPSNAGSIDYFNINPEHSHMPLVIMLVLTQLSVGAFTTQLLLKNFVESNLLEILFPVQILTALGLGLLALASSILHLGRPQYAFRAILGFKTSWLSKEIVAFAIFAKLAVLYAACSWFVPIRDFVINVVGVQAFDYIGASVGVCGILGVYCSVMVYKDTKRPFWDNHLTTLKFYLTAGILGCATILLSSTVCVGIYPELLIGDVLKSFGNRLASTIMILSVLKLVIEGFIFVYLGQGDLSFFKKSALIMVQHLRMQTIFRFGLGAFGGIVLPFTLLSLQKTVNFNTVLTVTVAIFCFTLMAELLARYLFFSAVVPLKMPGGSK
ncbi:MAG: formate dehydrogenase iron-sulfur subunit [Lysobacterales bacterium]|jgi:formate dehydrogenase iron-sulfur subunit